MVETRHMTKSLMKPRTKSIAIEQTESRRRDEAGVTLLEILIAVSILGICFSALFSSFSTALRTTDRVDRYSQAIEFAHAKLNELLVDPTLGAGDQRSGATRAGLRWKAVTEAIDQRPGAGPDKPIQLLRIVLEVSWPTSTGTQSFVLQTLKLRLPQLESNP
jgi:prepilin-type N-terminal cleavage/methylation domain-containing protein